MAGRDTTIADVQNKCPEFKNHKCPYTGLKGHFRSPVLQDGCIVQPGQCKTLGEVTDILASKVPADKDGQKALANDLQDAVRLSYIKARQLEDKRCPVLHGGCPFAFTKEGKPVLDPASAIGSVYVTMADIKQKCPTFNKDAKACPYKLKALNGLGKGCPEFKDGHCPFLKIQDVGEFKELLGKMRDQHKSARAKSNAHKAIQLIDNANKAEAKVHGNCPFFKFGCHFATDLNGNPIEN